MVGESGIRSGADVAKLIGDGAHAVLIGEHFMRAPSPGEALRNLIAETKPMSIQIKICGITRPRDAALAAQLGATHIGINFWPQSKRCIPVDKAPTIASAARAVNPHITVVGVFVNQSRTFIGQQIANALLDSVQLHGNEQPQDCQLSPRIPTIKAIPLSGPADVARIATFPCENDSGRYTDVAFWRIGANV